MKHKKVFKVMTIAASVMLAGGALAGCASNDEDMFTQKYVDDKVQEAKDSIVCVPCKCEPITCNITECEICEVCEACSEPEVIEIEIEIDNKNMDTVIKYFLENDEEGFVLVTDDLDEEETDKVVDRILFVNEAKAMAEKLVEKEGLEYLDDETEIFNEGELDDYRDDDVYSFNADEDETTISVDDFDDKEATIMVEVRMKLKDDGDREKVDVIFEVEANKDEFEIVDAYLKEE